MKTKNYKAMSLERLFTLLLHIKEAQDNPIELEPLDGTITLAKAKQREMAQNRLEKKETALYQRSEGIKSFIYKKLPKVYDQPIRVGRYDVVIKKQGVRITIQINKHGEISTGLYSFSIIDSSIGIR